VTLQGRVELRLVQVQSQGIHARFPCHRPHGEQPVTLLR
jgi:hypothetical protein